MVLFAPWSDFGSLSRVSKCLLTSLQEECHTTQISPRTVKKSLASHSLRLWGWGPVVAPH